MSAGTTADVSLVRDALRALPEWTVDGIVLETGLSKRAVTCILEDLERGFCAVVDQYGVWRRVGN